MQLIPLTDSAHQTARVRLAGQSVALRLSWAVLLGRWYLSLRWTANDRPIALGRQVVAASRLLRAGARVEGFVGDLVVDPPRRGTPNPGRDAWSTGYRLLYLTPDEDAGMSEWL